MAQICLYCCYFSPYRFSCQQVSKTILYFPTKQCKLSVMFTSVFCFCQAFKVNICENPLPEIWGNSWMAHNCQNLCFSLNGFEYNVIQFSHCFSWCVLWWIVILNFIFCCWLSPWVMNWILRTRQSDSRKVESFYERISIYCKDFY